jgi:hypothetical protein
LARDLSHVGPGLRVDARRARGIGLRDRSHGVEEIAMDVRRLLPLTGVVFVVLALVAVIGLGGDTPDSAAPAAEVASFYDDNAVRQAIGAFLLAVSVPFLLFFAVSIAIRLRPPAEDRPAWRYVILCGATLTAAALLMTAAVVFALADGGDNGISGEALQALNVLGADAWVAFNAGFGVMMLGAAGCLLRGTLVPRWLGWIALALGILLFIPFADFFALLLTLIWIVVVSIVLFSRAGAAEPVVASAA